MNRDVNSALAQGLFEFVYEQALAAGARQRCRLHFVAAGAYRHDFYREPPQAPGDRVPYKGRLRQGQSAGPRANT